MFSTIRTWVNQTISLVGIVLDHEAVRAISREGALLIAVLCVILSAVAVILCPRS